MSDHCTLYGIPCSLYTAKARSYMRKQKVSFRELSISDRHYQQEIMPKIGRMIMPVLELSSGELIQDSADIIRHFETQRPAAEPALPETPVLRALSYLFELFGGEGLLRPAMHYRWNFDDINLDYLRSEFECLAPAGTDDASYQQIFEFCSNSMRQAARSFGVSERTRALIEASYGDFLDLFSAHLRHYPYLLGSAPTLGDYALMGPLYAHLYRDPKPGQLMRQRAPLVARWVERMNTAEENWADHPQQQQAAISDDKLPDTLTALMRYIAEDYLPEMVAHIKFANGWLAERPHLDSGTNGMDDPTKRFIGKAEFSWRGTNLKTSVIPYRFYLLQELQHHFDKSTPDTQKALRQCFKACGLDELLSLRVNRRLDRRNFLEVWI
ncbi:MAG: glutathione S-transferase [Bermanella sp.]|jgi:glutathione S-transferase